MVIVTLSVIGFTVTVPWRVYSFRYYAVALKRKTDYKTACINGEILIVLQIHGSRYKPRHIIPIRIQTSEVAGGPAGLLREIHLVMSVAEGTCRRHLT